MIWLAIDIPIETLSRITEGKTMQHAIECLTNARGASINEGYEDGKNTNIDGSTDSSFDQGGSVGTMFSRTLAEFEESFRLEKLAELMKNRPGRSIGFDDIADAIDPEGYPEDVWERLAVDPDKILDEQAWCSGFLKSFIEDYEKFKKDIESIPF